MHSTECTSARLRSVGEKRRADAVGRNREDEGAPPRDAGFFSFSRSKDARSLANKRDRFSYLAAEPKPTAQESSKEMGRRSKRKRKRKNIEGKRREKERFRELGIGATTTKERKRERRKERKRERERERKVQRERKQHENRA